MKEIQFVVHACSYDDKSRAAEKGIRDKMTRMPTFILYRSPELYSREEMRYYISELEGNPIYAPGTSLDKKDAESILETEELNFSGGIFGLDLCHYSVLESLFEYYTDKSPLKKIIFAKNAIYKGAPSKGYKMRSETLKDFENRENNKLLISLNKEISQYKEMFREKNIRVATEENSDEIVFHVLK